LRAYTGLWVLTKSLSAIFFVGTFSSPKTFTMKTHVLLALILAVALGATNSASAQSATPNTRTNALQALRNQGYTVVYDKSCAISQGNYCQGSYTFTAGNEYKMYSSSDDGDVKDVDIYVTNSSGEIVRKDQDELDWCMLNWTQSGTYTYTFKSFNHRSETPSYESRVWTVIGEKRRSSGGSKYNE